MKNVKTYIRQNLLQPRIFKFAVVGLSGVLVNMGLLYALTQYFGLYYILSSIIAIEVSILTNFVLNDIWTWKDRQKKSYWKRIFQYHISVGITAVLANWLLLIFFTEVVDLHYMLANLIGISVGMLFNYTLNDLWTFRGQN
ncbi:MAG TPA: GtrA family protein [Calditrichaeota bacterium]|nr:GtrA family protein [Calditrichota bacterium]